MSKRRMELKTISSQEQRLKPLGHKSLFILTTFVFPLGTKAEKEKRQRAVLKKNN